jgi:hypothetical protein
MSRLDPALAAVPLDTGLVPARMAQPRVARTASIAQYTATKTARKVRQRLHGSRRDQFGASGFASLVLTHWRCAPESVQPLRQTGFIAQAWLDGLLDGRRSAPASTIAFMVNLLVAADAVGARP